MTRLSADKSNRLFRVKIAKILQESANANQIQEFLRTNDERILPKNSLFNFNNNNNNNSKNKNYISRPKSMSCSSSFFDEIPSENQFDSLFEWFPKKDKNMVFEPTQDFRLSFEASGTNFSTARKKKSDTVKSNNDRKFPTFHGIGCLSSGIIASRPLLNSADQLSHQDNHHKFSANLTKPIKRTLTNSQKTAMIDYHCVPKVVKKMNHQRKINNKNTLTLSEILHQNQKATKQRQQELLEKRKKFGNRLSRNITVENLAMLRKKEIKEREEMLLILEKVKARKMELAKIKEENKRKKSMKLRKTGPTILLVETELDLDPNGLLKILELKFKDPIDLYGVVEWISYQFFIQKIDGSGVIHQWLIKCFTSQDRARVCGWKEFEGLSFDDSMNYEGIFSCQPSL